MKVLESNEFMILMPGWHRLGAPSKTRVVFIAEFGDRKNLEEEIEEIEQTISYYGKNVTHYKFVQETVKGVKG